MGKGPHRVTLAERQAELERHPERDPRPRYGDGTLARPGDVVLHAGVTGKAQWFTRTQEVPVVAYDAVVTDVGTVRLKDCRLHERTTP